MVSSPFQRPTEEQERVARATLHVDDSIKALQRALAAKTELQFTDAIESARRFINEAEREVMTKEDSQ